MTLVRYSMLITEKDLKVLYKIYEENKLLANIILEYRDNRIYTSLIMMSQIEIEELSRMLKLAKKDFLDIVALKKSGEEIEISKLLEENVVKK